MAAASGVIAAGAPVLAWTTSGADPWLRITGLGAVLVLCAGVFMERLPARLVFSGLAAIIVLMAATEPVNDFETPAIAIY